MTAWTVVLRGIRYRAGRSMVVVLLALIASTAAVLAPAYSRAAQQSVLTDGLREATENGTSLAIGAEGTAASAPAAHNALADARSAIGHALERHPVLVDLLGRGVGGVDTEATTEGRTPLATRFAYRDGVCSHLRLVSGQCPSEKGQVLVSDRTATAYGLGAGNTISLRLGGAASRQAHQFQIVGVYAPKDPAEAYWGRGAYFASGGTSDNGAERVDAVFAGAEEDVRLDAEATVALQIEYPIRTADVRLDGVGPLKRELGSFGLALRTAELDMTTGLPSTLDEIDTDQGAIGRTVPVIAVPLVLLCWFVLFLLVASLTEERGPEIALAKLRGYPSGRAARFGLGEVLLLIALAAPAGVVAGLSLVELAARLTLATGTHVELRWPVFAAAGVALAATAFAALLAGRRTLRRPVLALLRRVPERTRWQAGVAEGFVVALAGVSLFAAMDERGAPLALLAPALLAVVAGVAAARLLGLWSRMRLVVARRRGRVPALLSAAQISRRPGGQRVVVVVTVAVALLAFAATAWDVSADARREAADDAIGADRVYTVAAPHPQALTAAVAKADPGGHAMAVVRVGVPYADTRVELLGVDASKLPGVAVWRGQNRAALDHIAAELRPRLSDSLQVKDHVDVDIDTRSVSEGVPVRLSAVVSAPGEPPRTVALGLLSRGPKVYRATVVECRGGCRLLGLALAPATTGSSYAATLTVRAIRSNDGDLKSRFDAADAWRLAAGSRASATVRPGVALGVALTSSDQNEALIEYVDTPPALPAVLAGAAPTDDPAGGRFTFPGFADQPQAFTVAEHAARLPRAGSHGLLFDLDYAVRAAERTAGLADSSQLRYEVWAAPAAPADLGARLGANGLSVLREESVAGQLDKLSRRAPALGLRLYLLAAAAAVALAVGVVVLTAYIGVDARLYELAALRVAGVRRRLLRRGVLREYLALLAMPLVVGFAAGAAGAVLMLPGMPLVTANTPAGEISWRPGVGDALPLAIAVTGLGLLLTLTVVMRLLRRATPDRLREVGR